MESRQNLDVQQLSNVEKREFTPLTEEEIAENKERIKQFLSSILSGMDMEVELEMEFRENSNELYINLVGPDMGILIGKRGQTLDSLQYLCSLVLNKDHKEDYLRVKLDTEDYRKRREQTLRSLAKNIAIDSRVPVAFFSLEMNNVQLVNRLLSNVCSISGSKILSGQLDPADWERFDNNLRKMDGAPIYVDDTPGLSVFELRTKARRLVREHGIKVLMVDYLQLMNANGMRFSSRQEEVSTISRSLKGLAKELNIPVLALSQLNRTVEQRDGIEGKRPQLSDLRESGAIEQDADLVLFVHRPEYYRIFQDEKGNDLHGKAQIIIAKHRKGATDDVLLSFRGEYTRFANPDEDSFMPAGLPNDFGGEIIGSKMNDDPLPPPDDRPPF